MTTSHFEIGCPLPFPSMVSTRRSSAEASVGPLDRENKPKRAGPALWAKHPSFVCANNQPSYCPIAQSKCYRSLYDAGGRETRQSSVPIARIPHGMVLAAQFLC
jgi:hypothetical protein